MAYRDISPVEADALRRWYEHGKLIGGIGSDTLEDLLDISSNYIDVVRRDFSFNAHVSILDLGSGVGIPGLPMAVLAPNWQFCLLESMTKRGSHAKHSCEELGILDRVSILIGRAEQLRADLMSQFDVVVSRCFGNPALLVELGLPFVRIGGIIVVSEPPNSDAGLRWRTDVLAKLGVKGPEFVVVRERHYAVLRKIRSLRPAGARQYSQILKNPLW